MTMEALKAPQSRMPMRLIAVMVIVFSLAGSALFAHPSVRTAQAQETFPAAVVEGSCDDPGEILADLRSVTPAEGGALTSFTTIDVPIDDLTGGDYAVLIGSSVEPVSCGDISGDGANVYISLIPVAEDLGGIAWLHDRDGRTQVSLFLGNGLGGSGTAPTDEGDDDLEPPVDETPDASSGETATYTSPSFGYTVTYDTSIWLVDVEETDVGPEGPSDFFVLNSIKGEAIAQFISLTGDQSATAAGVVDQLQINLPKNVRASSSKVRTDQDGNPILGSDADHAYVALDMTFDNPDGSEDLVTFHCVVWEQGVPGELLALVFQTYASDYDQWTPERERLEEGVAFPDSE